MSQATRLAKQHEQAAKQAAEYLRQRQLLAPRPIAVSVRYAYHGYRTEMDSSFWTLVQLGVLRDPRLPLFGTVQKQQETA